VLRSLDVEIAQPGRVELTHHEVSTDDLGPEEVIVEARCSVISPGTELAHFRGDSQNGVLPHAGRRGYPFRPGYAMAGVVVAAGADAGLSPGQRVLSHTTHSSVSRFDRRNVVCVALPDEIDDRVAPFARLAQVSGVILQLSSARPGDIVAVVGLGAIGNLAAQLARESSMVVVGVDPSPYRRRVAEASEIPYTFAIDEAAGGVRDLGGARVVLECSGRAAGVVLAADLCAHYGEVMTIGAPWREDPEVPASRLVSRVFEKFLALRSGWEWQTPKYDDGHGRSVAGCTAWILDLLVDKAVLTDPLVSDDVTPSEAQSAYERLDRTPDEHLTFIMDWREVVAP
jgi:2-desacetyl-2-hydroxyethyl bacteriochlorophyllide A dehydrogenase